MQDAVGARGEVGIVGDDDEARTRVAIELEHQPEYFLRGVSIEIAGRLVGEHDGRRRDQRARQRDALTLAARKLAGTVFDAMGESDALEYLARSGARLRWRIASGIATFSTAENSGSKWWNW